MKGFNMFLAGVFALALISGGALVGCEIFGPVEKVSGETGSGETPSGEGNDGITVKGSDSLFPGETKTYVLEFKDPGLADRVYWTIEPVEKNANDEWVASATSLKDETTIGSGGKLTVASDEVPRSVRIKAELISNISIVGSLIVEIKEREENLTLFVVGGHTTIVPNGEAHIKALGPDAEKGVTWELKVKSPIAAVKKAETKLYGTGTDVELRVASDEQDLVLTITASSVTTGKSDFVDIAVKTSGLEVTAKPSEKAPDVVIENMVVGGEQLFEAKLGNDVYAASWSVAGFQRKGATWEEISLRVDTTIDTFGKLKVSLDEIATRLVITAKLLDYPSITGSVPIILVPANNEMGVMLVELSNLTAHEIKVDGYKVTITGSGSSDPNPLELGRGQTLTIPHGVSLTLTDTYPNNVINGDIIVRGDLIIDNMVTADGMGTITVENGGSYTDNHTVALSFLTTGKTIVKGGGVLKVANHIWGGTPAANTIFIGTETDTESIIRLPLDGTVSIKGSYASTPAVGSTYFAYELSHDPALLSGLIVVREGKEWKLKDNETIAIKEGAVLTVDRRATLRAAGVAAGPGAGNTITLADGASIVTKGTGKVLAGVPTSASSIPILQIGNGDNTFLAVVKDYAKPITIDLNIATITVNDSASATLTVDGSGLFLGTDTKALSLQAQAHASGTKAVFAFTGSDATAPANRKPVILSNGEAAISLRGDSATGATIGAKLAVDAVGRIVFGTGIHATDGILLGYGTGGKGTLALTLGAKIGAFTGPGATSDSTYKTIDPTVVLGGATFTKDENYVLKASGSSLTAFGTIDQTLTASTALTP
ncbi:hypothetical protein AGMMS49940_06800 [Spirochaetia bacterium]|nr:hypothetical protein AGMMS49940_06800 [Spirochaetia bacterium]